MLLWSIYSFETRESLKLMNIAITTTTTTTVIMEKQPATKRSLNILTSLDSRQQLRAHVIVTSVQDRSLQCPSNTIWPFKIYHLSQNNPSKRMPTLNTKMSLGVLNILCPPQESTTVGHEVELDG